MCAPHETRKRQACSGSGLPVPGRPQAPMKVSKRGWTQKSPTQGGTQALPEWLLKGKKPQAPPAAPTLCEAAGVARLHREGRDPPSLRPGEPEWAVPDEHNPVPYCAASFTRASGAHGWVLRKASGSCVGLGGSDWKESAGCSGQIPGGPGGGYKVRRDCELESQAKAQGAVVRNRESLKVGEQGWAHVHTGLLRVACLLPFCPLVAFSCPESPHCWSEVGCGCRRWATWSRLPVTASVKLVRCLLPILLPWGLKTAISSAISLRREGAGN